jgi:hypothetical protein
VEAIGNKIKLIMHVSYTSRNIDNLIVLIILRCSEAANHVAEQDMITP